MHFLPFAAKVASFTSENAWPFADRAFKLIAWAGIIALLSPFTDKSYMLKFVHAALTVTWYFALLSSLTACIQTIVASCGRTDRRVSEFEPRILMILLFSVAAVSGAGMVLLTPILSEVVEAQLSLNSARAK